MSIEGENVSFCWGPGFGLPSFQPSSLAIHTFERFTSVGLEFKNCNIQKISPSGKLPVLKCKDQIIPGANAAIMHMMDTLDVNLDFNLSDSTQGESAAFVSLIEDKIGNAIEHMWYAEKDNLTPMRRLINKHLAFPLGWIVPSRMIKEAKNNLAVRGLNNPTVAYSQCRAGLHAISQKLGTSRYLFCDSDPTSIDAILFGHLAVILYCDLPTNPLYKLLGEFPNLVAYTVNILETFYADDIKLPESIPGRRGSEAYHSSDDEEYESDDEIYRQGRPRPAGSFYTHEPNQTERENDRGTRNAIVFGIASLAAFAFFSDWFKMSR